MEWLLREYMTKKHIRSMTELAKLTGIEYRTLLNHVNNVGNFRIYEVLALNEVLGLSDSDLLKILREGK